MQLVAVVRRAVVRDAALAAGLAAVSVVMAVPMVNEIRLKFGTGTDIDVEAIWRGRIVVWCVVALPAVAAVFLRRRWPLAALALAAASAAVHMLGLDLWPLPMDLACVVAIYTVVRFAPSRRRGLAVLAVALGVLFLAEVAAWAGVGPPRLAEIVKGESVYPDWPGVMLTALGDALAPALALGIAWAVGDNSRTRRLHLATLEQRAADLRRERDHRAALAVAAERARIARELHDVVAHGISVMVVQAQGGAAALHRHPDRTATALANIVATGRASLAEMRRLLGIARGAAGVAELAPQPGLGALAALVDQVRDAGTPVTLVVEGEPSPLPAAVDLSAYRIVQEALTNTRKHAGPGTSATIRLSFAADRLEIEVSDDGVGSASTVEGNGLRGIAERVKVLHGTVWVGPRPGGGFAVRVGIPIT